MTTTQPEIDSLVERARAAQQRYEATGSQQYFDKAAAAAAWALMEPSRNAELAKFAVAETGLGNVADKITKNHRKTLGLLRDIQGQKSFGLIDDNPLSEKTFHLYRSQGFFLNLINLAYPTLNNDHLKILQK